VTEEETTEKEDKEEEDADKLIHRLMGLPAWRHRDRRGYYTLAESQPVYATMIRLRAYYCSVNLYSSLSYVFIAIRTCNTTVTMVTGSCRIRYSRSSLNMMFIQLAK